VSVTTIRRAPEKEPVTGRAKRRAERTRSSASKGSWLLAVALIALIVAAGWWVTHSAIFQARTITVSGNHRLTDEQIVELGGVGKRTNVLWFSPRSVEDRLESSPWIGTAHVSRTLPSTMKITVTELSALAVLDTGTGRYLLAPDGTVLGPATARANLPVIYLAGAQARVAQPAPGVGESLRAVAGLPRGVRSRVDRVLTEPNGDLVLVLAGGVRVVYGDGSETAAKGEALAAILEWAGRTGVSLASVDVRVPTTPVASPVAAPDPAPSDTASAAAGPEASASPGPSPSPSPSPAAR
jgi:cell division protein FtsQ